ncbi:hypothetical protein HMPREF0868_0107 [Mageeibacillus indolicus UPII9-5]|uniref:Uncharacterized protein n=1 Tax=Mageeibacillus indolicus (strain UPII9-5) TaxID=699246 RepID=D3QZV2_MAGIU|nr:hypothetical protein HMPREF0868_0107 [Mageeibacillus indolicus UPII9-5]
MDIVNTADNTFNPLFIIIPPRICKCEESFVTHNLSHFDEEINKICGKTEKMLRFFHILR